MPKYNYSSAENIALALNRQHIKGIDGLPRFYPEFTHKKDQVKKISGNKIVHTDKSEFLQPGEIITLRGELYFGFRPPYNKKASGTVMWTDDGWEAC